MLTSVRGFFVFLHILAVGNGFTSNAVGQRHNMAKLALTLSKDKFDELEDSVKAFYTTTQDGGYELDGVGSLNRALKAEKDSKQAAIDKAVADAVANALKAYDGLDPDEAKKALDERQKAAEDKLKESGDFKAIEDQYKERIRLLEEKAAKDVKTEQDARADLLNNLKKERLANALTEQGVLPERVEFLRDKLEKEMELVATENGFTLKKIGGIGDAAEFEGLIDSLKSSPKTDFFFAPTNTPGSGASGSDGHVPSGKKRSEMSVDERIAAIDKLGKDKYLELPA